MSNLHHDGAENGAVLLNESPRLTLTQLARQQGKGPSTTWRWALRGCRGAKLETFLVGGTRYTTGPAFERFVAAINAAPTAIGGAKVATSRQREAAIAAAEAELARAGV
ncbi:MAG: DUF1580 domain-containing protein [Pirellulales bacterium]|nr:DUF1580 domain-containing protein [Pirellulales bacterium]